MQYLHHQKVERTSCVTNELGKSHCMQQNDQHVLTMWVTEIQLLTLAV